ncbi:MAG: serine hydrolase [Rubrivivax sp.]|nr:serine hydrolase [Rubrivivax sp.]
MSELARALHTAVLARDFGNTADQWHRGAAVTHFPSIDLAVAAFPRRGPPRWANVLFSREQPQGLIADLGAQAGPARNLRFDRDLQDAKGNSIAWQAGRNWRHLPWQPLAGTGATRFVAPYPASLLKLMVAVGLGLAVDRGLCGWPDALAPMITVSDNDATTECVALLHRVGLLGAAGNALNANFAARGLATLRLDDTQPDGGWRNSDGAGVGHIHMTAWDTVRLLWLLDGAAPLPPWLAPDTPPLLQPPTAAHLHEVLRRQQLDHVLSSGSLKALPGWVPGGPDAPAFAHKTGSTDNYASDAGIVQTGDTHYLVAVLTSLGRRYAPHADAVTTWRLPALGAAVHRLMEGLT